MRRGVTGNTAYLGNSLDTLSWRQRDGAYYCWYAYVLCMHTVDTRHQVRAIVDLDLINYATKYTTEIVESIIFLL